MFFNSHFVFVSGKHISFLNACAFGFAVIRYEISFMANNIFGSKKYERNVVYSSTIQYTVNSLRPREFMLEVSFSL